MISKTLQDAFNKQLNAETFSAYLYWSMSAYFESKNLAGAATWMRAQAQEEMAHAVKFYDYLNERGGRVILAAIDPPETKWDSPLAVFEAVYRHEQKVTGMINNLVNLASQEGDHASGVFLQWFVTEQVQEEATANEVIGKLKLMAGAPGALFMMDRELGQRVFAAPPAEGESQ